METKSGGGPIRANLLSGLLNLAGNPFIGCVSIIMTSGLDNFQSHSCLSRSNLSFPSNVFEFMKSQNGLFCFGLGVFAARAAFERLNLASAAKWIWFSKHQVRRFTTKPTNRGRDVSRVAGNLHGALRSQAGAQRAVSQSPTPEDEPRSMIHSPWALLPPIASP